MTETEECIAGKVMHCYIREHIFMSARERSDLLVGLSKFAHRMGYQFGKVFTEKPESVPEGFSALVQAVLDDHASAIAVPSLHHFGVIGYPVSVRECLKRSTGVPVLIPEDPRG